MDTSLKIFFEEPFWVGVFERFSTFSAAVFNAILGIYLMKGAFACE